MKSPKIHGHSKTEKEKTTSISHQIWVILLRQADQAEGVDFPKFNLPSFEKKTGNLFASYKLSKA